MSPIFLRNQAAREAARAFYRLAPAYVESLQPRIVDEYSTVDNFGLGLTPRACITSITIFIDATCIVYRELPSNKH
ncbi:hypothetical protein EJ02DRAFT_454771 [Clathrospora elynae]|uniref:Uncharacterized protein n=1 Tax=Clathrospora elynae TaxID=706981 RepID=A0A6A5SQB6_9PLEO|nr:hypothetical protein EJ02DRAFT_454771 [Clathrospora elynae]